MIEELIKLKDYVPLFQTFIWIIFIIIILLIFRKSVWTIINLLIDRVKKGSSIKVGPVEIGEELKNLTYAKQGSGEIKAEAKGKEREKHRTNIYSENKGLFLTHIISPSKKIGQKYDIFIYLIRHKSTDFNDIDYAEFFFGHMWGNEVFKESLKNGIIGISTSAYAPFLCTCCVKFKDGSEIELNRYIDFEMEKCF